MALGSLKSWWYDPRFMIIFMYVLLSLPMFILVFSESSGSSLASVFALACFYGISCHDNDYDLYILRVFLSDRVYFSRVWLCDPEVMAQKNMVDHGFCPHWQLLRFIKFTQSLGPNSPRLSPPMLLNPRTGKSAGQRPLRRPSGGECAEWLHGGSHPRALLCWLCLENLPCTGQGSVTIVIGLGQWGFLCLILRSYIHSYYMALSMWPGYMFSCQVLGRVRRSLETSRSSYFHSCLRF